MRKLRVNPKFLEQPKPKPKPKKPRNPRKKKVEWGEWGVLGWSEGIPQYGHSIQTLQSIVTVMQEIAAQIKINRVNGDPVEDLVEMYRGMAISIGMID